MTVLKRKRISYATSGCAMLFVLLTLLTSVPLHAQSRTHPSPAPQSITVNEREIDTLAMRAHTRFLSDDLLRGRGTGTEGERIAAAYLESQLISLGLDGVGPHRAFQLPVPLRSATILPSSSLTVTISDFAESFEYGRTFIVNTGGAKSFRDFSGNVFYAGAAITALPLLRASTDLRGSIIAFNGSLGSDALAIVPLLIERGASGVILLVNDPAQFDLYVRSRGESRFFAAENVADPVWQPDIPEIIAGPAVIRKLFSRSPEAAAAKSLTALVPLSLKADVHIASELHDVPAFNVGGIIRGSDPHRTDIIVYTAHYDHLGISVPDARGDSIYNGFSDNAAGCAMLLAIAEAFRKHPPAFSVAFLFFTGEERGLLGSSYMAAFPPFPLSRIKALINLDAGAPPVPPVSWRLAGGTEVAALGTVAIDIAKRSHWQTTLSAASPNSDYWPFLHRGVPAVFIIPGNDWENTTKALRDSLMARWDHYHEAADEWSPDFPFSGLARYAAYALALGRASSGLH